MSGLIAKKIGMTSIFDAEGKMIPCTIVEAGPCIVTHIKTQENDGYTAIQLAFGEKKDRHASKALKNHYAKANTTPKQKAAEFKYFEQSYNLGDTLTAELFAPGDFVDVTGTSIGKGFQGVVKRHNFAGVGGQTHGQHNRLRAPGSLGASSFPSRVFKGMRMAGHQGNVNVKVQNLQVIRVDADKNLVFIKGAIPGHEGNFIKMEK